MSALRRGTGPDTDGFAPRTGVQATNSIYLLSSTPQDNPDSKTKIPIVKKGGSFVIEANFVTRALSGFARQV